MKKKSTDEPAQSASSPSPVAESIATPALAIAKPQTAAIRIEDMLGEAKSAEVLEEMREREWRREALEKYVGLLLHPAAGGGVEIMQLARDLGFSEEKIAANHRALSDFHKQKLRACADDRTPELAAAARKRLKELQTEHEKTSLELRRLMATSNNAGIAQTNARRIAQLNRSLFEPFREGSDLKDIVPLGESSGESSSPHGAGGEK